MLTLLATLVPTLVPTFVPTFVPTLVLTLLETLEKTFVFERELTLTPVLINVDVGVKVKLKEAEGLPLGLEARFIVEDLEPKEKELTGVKTEIVFLSLSLKTINFHYVFQDLFEIQF